VLRLTLQAFWEDALAYPAELLLEVQVPVSAGKIERDVCYANKDVEIVESCQTSESGDDRVTLLVTKVKEFCSSGELYCRIFLQEFTNSKYQISSGINEQRDSFSFSLFYELDDGSRALIYQKGGVYASPALQPIKISVSSISLMPEQSKTAQEVSIQMRIDSERSDVLNSKYLLTRFAADQY